MGGKRTMPDMTGVKCNYFTVIERTTGGRIDDYWLCQCECGQFRKFIGYQLRKLLPKSCGCKTKELLRRRFTIHGYTDLGHPKRNTYHVWFSMVARCENPKHKSYKDYGGRGIKVCDRWKDFRNFLEDMGDVPTKLSLGRIDGNGNYSKDNCRWETWKEQANNRRSSKIITFNGKTQTLKQWADELGFPSDALGHRLYAGWDIERALTEPMKKQKNSRHAQPINPQSNPHKNV